MSILFLKLFYRNILFYPPENNTSSHSVLSTAKVLSLERKLPGGHTSLIALRNIYFLVSSI